ncbi:hypothetical protein [Bacillus haynesii]|uniref:hypothetical protein n=1 Tax=Bacillus haynesii TaxID=1925021 RepID=UPI002281E231|nr:hypothetical protein [Bacillus haynesii]MCY7912974.1 hypothetical protein [Bacillus haynesii]MCY7927178.1 hypothetical protein [Bacillus haynesii]MCY8771921.1 hypothetical protein [Bacillus haynesii]MCY9336899.1 hypothetical protein [Bacillus haynesii]MEC0700579.1 hypothetical protein [Bacillus haynesii]
MTETMTNTLIALAGLGIGVLGIVIVYSVNRRIGKKRGCSMNVSGRLVIRLRRSPGTLQWPPF